MPLERTSKSFKDLSMTFQVNPMNYDIIALKNESAIARSIRNLVLTQPGERFFNQNLGSRIEKMPRPFFSSQKSLLHMVKRP